jgi:capsular polysaccharide biosynthesis protein
VLTRPEPLPAAQTAPPVAAPVSSEPEPEPAREPETASDPAPRPRKQRRSHPLRTSLLIALAVFLLLTVAGGIVVAGRPQEYTAEASVVILPLPGSDRTTEAGLFETLSRGQIVETFAELTRNQRFAAQAKTVLQLTDSQRKGAYVDVTTVPSTSIVLISAHARDPETAERLADKTMELATGYFATLPQPFRTDQVDTAEGSATKSGTSRALLFAAVLATAFAAALAIQQASYQLHQAARARRAGAAGSEAPPTTPAAEAEPSAD